ncbi:MAG: radical SAM protein [Nanoarchaeota archaeon]|nr:radical SAM protein [Nanoarchaeota archaeon]
MHRLEHIDYEITKACNLRCIHCSAEAGKGNIPDMDFIRKNLQAGSKLGLKRVGITGGEPFLFPWELSDLIDFSFDELKCPVHIHTNGQLVSDNLNLLSERREKVENLTFTLLGNKRIHDNNCGLEGVYQKLRGVVTPLLNLGIPLTIFLIPMSNNYSELPKAVREFYEAGIRRFRVMALAPGGRAKDNYKALSLNEEQSSEFLEQVICLQKELGIEFEAGHCTRLVYPQLKSLKHHSSCMSGVNRLHINADGYVFPCTASSGFIKMNVGNLYEQSLEDVWENPLRLGEFRDLPKEKCRVQQHYIKEYPKRV